MNIRLIKETEISEAVGIWYEASLIAHDFIGEDYWKTHKKEMEETYIPMSETYVIRKEEAVIGFASLVDHYLAALFIDRRHQGRGYGGELLNFIKEIKETLRLKVYKKNNQAVQFYLNNGFVIKGESFDENTSEEEFILEWSRDTVEIIRE